VQEAQGCRRLLTLLLFAWSVSEPQQRPGLVLFDTGRRGWGKTPSGLDITTTKPSCHALAHSNTQAKRYPNIKQLTVAAISSSVGGSGGPLQRARCSWRASRLSCALPHLCGQTIYGCRADASKHVRCRRARHSTADPVVRPGGQPRDHSGSSSVKPKMQRDMIMARDRPLLKPFRPESFNSGKMG
jgi:hypothetical protein